MAHGARGQFRVWARTRGSPRSLRLRSFSCRLLTVSFASVPASASASAPAPPRPKPSKGDTTELHSLNTAYSGIWHTTQVLSTPAQSVTETTTARGTHDEIQPPHPVTKRAAADLAGPGDVDDVEGPLDDARAREVLARGDERVRRRVAPRGADALEVAREDGGGVE